jgi:hypothetical protein
MLQWVFFSSDVSKSDFGLHNVNNNSAKFCHLPPSATQNMAERPTSSLLTANFTQLKKRMIVPAAITGNAITVQMIVWLVDIF